LDFHYLYKCLPRIASLSNDEAFLLLVSTMSGTPRTSYAFPPFALLANPKSGTLADCSQENEFGHEDNVVGALDPTVSPIDASYPEIFPTSRINAPNNNLLTESSSHLNITTLEKQDAKKTPKYVQWKVYWQFEPAFMLLFVVAGTLLAMGHHLYYSFLNGTKPGSNSEQQWAHAFGNSFAFLFVTFYAAANKAAYDQYIWTLVRRKAFTIGTLDSLFALNSNPSGFFGLEILRKAYLAVILALICW